MQTEAPTDAVTRSGLSIAILEVGILSSFIIPLGNYSQ